MAKTRHIQKRMNQRAIDGQLLELVRDLGVTQDRDDVERHILNRKGLDESLRRLDRLRSRLIKARDKGGAVLVSGENGVEVTTYRLDSFKGRTGH